jgi:phosphatidylserine/phosphatidylglycerophosphate/cardiolipin synthase-like enzyme
MSSAPGSRTIAPGLVLPGLLAETEQTALLVDAEIYYASFCRAALLARRYIYLAGWQFDSLARLLRPDPEEQLTHPIELLPFLEYLCERTPQLQVFILAWDYSLFYALEREWLQKLKFKFQSHPRVHFEFSSHPGMGGCLHQKYVLIDDRLAFLGGLDVCDSRWDTRAHRAQDPARSDVHGNPYKAFHDIQVALRGPVVRRLKQFFRESWERVQSDELAPSQPAPLQSVSSQRVLAEPAPAPLAQQVLPAEPARPEAEAEAGSAAGSDANTGASPDSAFDLGRITAQRGLFLSATRVGLSRTDITCAGAPARLEVQLLFERAILSARRLIYVETQYFTSRVMAQAFCRRFADATAGPLDVVLVMPDGADTPKEDLVLGARQRAVRHLVAQEAARHGHRFRLLKSAQSSHEQAPPATFIHSKLLIVDDELLSVGSANLTNRSMSLDTELNVTCATALEQPACAARLRAEIATIRADLLAEHAGYESPQAFLALEQLIERIDEACLDPASKLRQQQIVPPESENQLLSAIFDPARPLDWESVELSLGSAGEWLRP